MEERTYQEKVQCIIDTFAHKRTDHIPTLALIGTWAIANAGGTVKEMEEDPQKEKEYYLKVFDDLQCDAVMTNGIVNDAKSSRIVGNPDMFISADGTSIQHLERMAMQEDEYPKLIADAYSFIVNEILPRKASRFQSYPDNYHAMNELIRHRMEKAQVEAELEQELKKRNVPVFNGNVIFPPLDILFDFLRSFKGLAVDLRRRPEMVEDACAALLPFSQGFLGLDPTIPELPKVPVFATMAHSPNFINAKQFARFWMPFYMQLVNPILEKGGNVVLNFEGTWSDKLDQLQDLPANRFAFSVMPEGADKLKRELGHKAVVVTGIDTNTLKIESKEACIEEAKRCCDRWGQDGGYIFATNRELVCANDVKKENLVAVYDYVCNRT